MFATRGTMGSDWMPTVAQVSGCGATRSDLEPVSGFEPLACRLQEARPHARRALPAQITLVIALTALAALGLSDDSFHEPFHARSSDASPPCYWA
jgi:hypothetical protein